MRNIALNLSDRPCFKGDNMPHMHRRRHPYLPLGLGNQVWLHHHSGGRAGHGIQV